MLALSCGPAASPVLSPDGGADAGAGVDAGAADAGADAGAPDGGGDAGSLDGGESTPIVSQCVLPTLADGGLDWSDAGYNLALNVPYNAIVPGGPQTLDVAWPLDGGLHPMVVVVHGGGFVAGDKASELPNIGFLAGLGYTAAAINYRLDSAIDAGFPVQVQDTRCALRYLKKHAANWGGDPSRFAAIGTSAGGYHVDMLGLTAQDAGLDGPCPSSDAPVGVTAVVSFFGPADLRDLSFFGTVAAPIPAKQAIVQFLGTTPDAGPAVAAAASPVSYVSAAAPPFLLVHGLGDPVVYPQNSVELWTLLRQAGAPATLLEIPGAGHGFPVFTTVPMFRASTCTTLSFLNARLQP